VRWRGGHSLPSSPPSPCTPLTHRQTSTSNCPLAPALLSRPRQSPDLLQSDKETRTAGRSLRVPGPTSQGVRRSPACVAEKGERADRRIFASKGTAYIHGFGWSFYFESEAVRRAPRDGSLRYGNAAALSASIEPSVPPAHGCLGPKLGILRRYVCAEAGNLRTRGARPVGCPKDLVQLEISREEAEVIDRMFDLASSWWPNRSGASEFWHVGIQELDSS
jgi:hypothetical protein